MTPPKGFLSMGQGDGRRRSPLPEFFGIAGMIFALGSLFYYFLAISWRRWPDPVIDFGRELYLPWRLSHGAVLYRDVEDYYGPLSQYFNSAVFTIFGPSLMHLAVANILIFVGILTITYFLFRRAWGTFAALTSLAVYIAVFGFSQLGDHGNYNYVTPYSQETTHGIIVCLALALVLARWVENETLAGSFLIGLLFGCTLVLKPEFVLAAALPILGAVGAKYRLGPSPNLSSLGMMVCGAFLPTASFALYFAVFMPWGDALNAACRGWLNAITTTRFSSYPLQLTFVGLDFPAENFCQELLGTLYAFYFIAIIAGAGWLADQRVRRWLHLLCLTLPPVGLVWSATSGVLWMMAGRCLPGLMLIYAGLCLAPLFDSRAVKDNQRANVMRLLLALLAMGLLMRMILNARIWDYGYYQAALAAIMVPAILIGELPQRLGLGRTGATAVVMGTFAFLVPGVVSVCASSNDHLKEKTVPVGSGGDRFYSSRYDRTGALVDSTSEALSNIPPDQTLVVLPEGVMINYLARKPSSVAPFCYFQMATENGREALVVDDLERHPPDCVVIISRGLEEYGIKRYGAEPGEGREIIDWVMKNYAVEASKGGNPLDPTQRGVVVLTRKAGFP